MRPTSESARRDHEQRHERSSSAPLPIWAGRAVLLGVLALVASSLPVRAATGPHRPLDEVELKANRHIEGGLQSGLLRLEPGEALALRAAALIHRGDIDGGAALLSEAPELTPEDCLGRTRLAESWGGTPCERHPPGQLDPLSRREAAAASIVAKKPEESNARFFASVMSASIRALGPSGSLRVETSADRFRISGQAVLEGLWYLDDRILVTSHPLAGRDQAAAQHALTAFLAERGVTIRTNRAVSPSTSIRNASPTAPPTPAYREAPEAAARARALGCSFPLPPGWHRLDSGSPVIFTSASVTGLDDSGFDSAASISLLTGSQVRSERKRLGRKRGSFSIEALPRAERISSRQPVMLPGGTTATDVSWRTTANGERRSVVRMINTNQGRVAFAYHLGAREMSGELPRMAIDIVSGVELSRDDE